MTPRATTELVARCRAGDEEAWSALVRRFSPYVHTIAIRGFRLTREEAEDLFQDVFVRVYEHLDMLRDDAALRPWIAQVARRQCLNRLQRTRPESPLPEVADARDEDDPLGRIEEGLTVWQALETLPGRCRELLERFYVRDESYATIGRELGLASGTIASRLSRCLDRLRDELNVAVAEVRAT